MGPATAATARKDARWALRGTAVLLGVSFAAAVFSLVMQGTMIGTNNNTFHLPILLRLYDLPQFADDAFIQSLRRFASFVYPLLSAVATERNVETVLLAAHLLTRTLNILALLLLARDLLPPLPRALPLALAVIILPGTLYGGTPLGAAGLFPSTFTHSELSQAMGLLTLLAAVHGRFLLAAPLWALTFSLNAFVGAWCLLPLALLALDLLRARRGPALRTLALAAALAALLALPNLLWLLSLLRGQAPLDFDYVTFLREYFPNHFLIDEAKPRNVAILSLHVAAGIAGLWVLGWPRRWCLAYAGFLGIFALGMIAPFLTHAPVVLNLHLLRVDGMLILLGTAFSAAAIPLLVLSPATPPPARAAALLILPSLFLGYWPADMDRAQSGVLAAALLLAAASAAFYGTACFRLARALPDALRQPRAVLPALLLAACWLLLPFQRGRLVEPSLSFLLAAALATALAAALAFQARRGLAVPVIVALAALFGVHAAIADHDSILRRVGAFPTDSQLIAIDPVSPDWNEVAEWARENTDPRAVFLIPPSLTGFETTARRRVWYDTRQGAAAMWAPGFYDQWKARRRDVGELHTLADALRYACGRGIGYVVADLRPDDVTTKLASGQAAPGRIKPDAGPGGPEPVFRNRSFQVFATRPCPAGS